MGKRIDWTELRSAYVEGVETDAGIEWPTLAEVAARFKCGQRAVEMRSSSEDWPAQRARFQARVAIKLREKKAEAMARKAAQLDEQFQSTAESILLMIGRLQANLAAEVAAGNAKGAAERQASIALAAQRAQKVAKLAIGDAADITRHELPRGEFRFTGGTAPAEDGQD